MKKIIATFLILCSFLCVADEFDDAEAADEIPIVIHISITNVHEAGSANVTTLNQRQEDTTVQQKLKENLTIEQPLRESRWRYLVSPGLVVGIFSYVIGQGGVR